MKPGVVQMVVRYRSSPATSPVSSSSSRRAQSSHGSPGRSGRPAGTSYSQPPVA
ncbi:MAG TPA: hypothetical protein VF092_03770 [Longimicrobium sp.]